MHSEFINLFRKFKEDIKKSNDQTETDQLLSDFEQYIIEEDLKNTSFKNESKEQIQYLEECLLEFQKDLTESINISDNTNEGLLTLLSFIPNLVYFKDNDLNYKIANRSFETWINKPNSEIVGKKDEEVYPEYLHRDIQDQEKEVMESGQGLFNFEEKIYIEESEIWLLTSISPYKDADGIIKGVINSSIDITLRKKHEIELEETKKKAYDALNIKNEFLANISHELRTPLHAIAGSVEMLNQVAVEGESKHLLKIIDQSSHSLLKQLNDLLMYSQAEAQQLENQDEEFNLKKSVKELFDKNKEELDAKGVELRWFVDDKIPDQLRGDKLKIVLLLDTLLSNSIKFTEKGFIHLVVKESVRDAENIKIRFDLIDTGIGVAKEKQNEIFELFSAGDSSSVKKYSGTGLGLSLARKILEILNAKYGFKSKEHVGSHFWFEIDLQSPIVEKELVHITARELPVLLVEDNLVNQKIAYFTLKKLGFPVDIAENGEEAVDKFQQKNYKLVLMDIQMPVMDGFDATRNIRMLEKDRFTKDPCIIIALSANVLSRDVQHCFEVGMNEFISKPFSSDKLLEKIQLYFNLN